MSIYDHYIPESEAKARWGCLNAIIVIVLGPLVVLIVYNLINEIEFDTLLIIGLIIILLGVALSTQKKMIEGKGFKTKARIIDFQPDITSKDVDNEYALEYPIVKFLSKNGVMKSEQVASSYAIGEYNRGDELRVIIYEEKIYVDPGISKRNILVISLGVLVSIFDLVYNH